jgi:hypothetical protein
MENEFDDRKSLVQYFKKEKQKGEKFTFFYKGYRIDYNPSENTCYCPDLEITGSLQDILNSIDRKEEEEERQERKQNNIRPRY